MHRFFVLLCFIFCAGCSSNIEYHGYSFRDVNREAFNKNIVKGASSNSIDKVLGTPMNVVITDKMLKAFYIEALVNYRPIIGQNVLRYNVLEITVDPKSNTITDVLFYSTSPQKVRYVQ
ncbi:hypothetical protein Fsol_00002 [Candidatus Fokinia solitaria]|uniref:Uncharacterized protein n=1 Tax=Candidatus Fokinia solitaria TaxID=1802984 RepID=A0A2U8BR41_9RICK|nr:hypothetical protein [Candidatus Fokinia solitaria]AWD32819.1 hypothetical protein Fsol_00002 [Candidatus Fokinia solitaria]